MIKDIEVFKKTQRLAYEGAVHTRSQLYEGITERETAEIFEKFFTSQGHHLYFHKPFVWFGERTAFRGFKRPGFIKGNSLPHLGKEFLPTDVKLKKGMPVILDVAPSVGGFAVDIGYSFSFGENAEVHKARLLLLTIRKIILEAVINKLPVKNIYAAVSNTIHEAGYNNYHSIYPLGVLGHRIGRLPLLKLPKLNIMGFHPQAYLYLAKEMLSGVTIVQENESRIMGDGLWAMEPHFGSENFGVKFEEILVIENGKVYWLDEDLPHLTEMGL